MGEVLKSQIQRGNIIKIIKKEKKSERWQFFSTYLNGWYIIRVFHFQSEATRIMHKLQYLNNERWLHKGYLIRSFEHTLNPQSAFCVRINKTYHNVVKQQISAN